MTVTPLPGALPATLHGGPHRDAPVLDLFTAWARRTPDAPAVVDGSTVTSYGELDRLADELASLLIDRVAPGELVGLCLDHSAALAAATLAVARLGAVALPLGPKPGERRLQAVAENLRLACLIGDAALLPPAHRGGEQLPLPLPAGGSVAAGPVVAAFAPAPEGAVGAPDGTFYAVLTSGSTGTPKAVAVGAPSLGSLLHWYRELTGLGPGDRHSLLIGVAFDPHLMELWAVLTSGAALYVAPEAVRWDSTALTDWWREAGITVSVLPTPLAEPLLDRPWRAGPTLRHLTIGGDRLRRAPGPDVTATVHNAYGPAEATVVTTVHSMPPGGGHGADAPPIGLPIPGVAVLVTDEDGRPVERGSTGELRIGGDCLALGYLDPELTARRFVPAPDLTAPTVTAASTTTATAPDGTTADSTPDRTPDGTSPAGLGIGDRVYRTGDRVLMRPDGVLEFHGRLDDQVKVSGVRIEPAEVEAAFERDPRVRRAAVAARPGPAGGVRLLAFVQPATEAAPPTGPELLAAARAWLPEQAVPAVVRLVDAFPLDANGKVDRAALLAAEQAAPAPSAEEGATDTERFVLRTCRELLGRAELGPSDDFKDAGGTSLAAARLLAALEQEFEVRLRAPQLLRCPDLRAVARLVDERRPVAAARS
ncbi:non-ribosomal peptide synthetase [Kitasatospora sp. NPDC096147]|uniref:non-ribosomal peptide synthetase n=1 Tax=Kitasatospora sp. NPDC096147 TaxID=3364093 RepID=UPI0038190A69